MTARAQSRSLPVLTIASFVSVLALMCVFALAAPAQTYTVLHTFTGNQDGGEPDGVTVDSHGVVYGTTVSGGTFSYQCPYGCGTVYKLRRMNSAWILSNLFSFQNLFDGAYPSPVTLAADGTIYGTVQNGRQGAEGIFYRLQPPLRPCHSVQCYWTMTSLYRFTVPTDGIEPVGRLVFDQAGNVYGTTMYGGSQPCGCGTAYQLTNNGGQWTRTVLHSFNGTDGNYPNNGLTLDPAGNLYGATPTGGTYNWGVIFQLANTGSGWVENVLYPFNDIGGLNGFFPGGVVLDGAGNLYGTASYGGARGGGTAFELVAATGYSFSLIYSFTGNGDDGSRGRLTLGPDGSFYGATIIDGLYSQGAIFKLTNQNGHWIYTSLHDFTGGDDGQNPYGDLALDAQGNIYGIAAGGAYRNGVVFEITP